MAPPPGPVQSERRLLTQRGLGACGGLQAGRRGELRVFIGGCLVARWTCPSSSSPPPWRWSGGRARARARLSRSCCRSGAGGARSRSGGFERKAQQPRHPLVASAASAWVCRQFWGPQRTAAAAGPRRTGRLALFNSCGLICPDSGRKSSGELVTACSVNKV